MMSIDNTYSEEEVRFDERVRRDLTAKRPTYVLEPKIDGVDQPRWHRLWFKQLRAAEKCGG